MTVGQAMQLPPPSPERPAYDAHGLALASGGRLIRAGQRPIRQAAVDSRRIEPGNVFVALPGEHTDGHRYLAAAVANGAAAVLVTRPLSPEDLAALADITVVQVADGLAALARLAGDWRRRFQPLVVGITGSVAKTSTKEAVAAVLGTQRRVLANRGNENNEVGLPLTLLRLTPAVQVAVLEMGMYVAGDIAQLAALAEPAIGVVTAVRGVHLERAGSLATIELEKGRLVEALPTNGTAVLNADDPRVLALRARTAATVVTYGFDAAADVRAEAVTSRGAAGMAYRLATRDVDMIIETPVLGRHNVHNALAAAAVGLAAGLPVEAIIVGLARPWGAPHRTTLIDAGPWRILDDTYNAGPDSMAAALALLAELPGRHVAVLGEMLELGEAGPAAHRAVGAAAAGAADVLIAVGAGGAEIAAGARAAGMAGAALDHVPDAVAAAARALERLQAGDTILVKGSRGVALETVVEALEAAGREASGG